MTSSTGRRPTLHVAALPFPSQQGTQAVIATMLSALAKAGRDSHLLCYPHAGDARELDFPVHRASDAAGFRSLRSGPGVRKAIADAELAWAVARTVKKLQPELIVAHHVEAGVATWRSSPRLFYAHTDLALELPTYQPRLANVAAERAGAALDRRLVQHAHAVATVSPALATQMRGYTDQPDKVQCVLPPWPLPELPSDRDAAHRAARVALQLEPESFVWLYAGNLDSYQGWVEIVRALAIAQAMLQNIVLLVCTASDPKPLLDIARKAGVGERIRVRSLGGEEERVQVHAAADAVLVPRKAPGGLPIKLLDALARGAACVVTPSACAGLPLDACVAMAKRDDGEALAAALLALLDEPERRARLGELGRRYVREHHGDAQFVQAFDAIAERAKHAALAR